MEQLRRGVHLHEQEPATPPRPSKPAFSYYGGKGRLAPWIASLFPAHRVYVEPFAGSAAVLLSKRPSTHEVLNDVDGNVVTFFRVLRDRPGDLERACRLTPYARDEFLAADLEDDSIDDLERARRFWVRCNQSFAATRTTATGWSTSIVRGANNARTAQNIVGRFQAVASRLANVTIEHRDALDILVRYDAPDAVAYLDPPYAGSVRTSYRDGRRPAGDYAHEMPTDFEHRALAAAAAEYSGTVIISGYPGALYDELYAGWVRLERSVVRRATNGRSGGHPKVIEALWCNRPIGDQLDLTLPIGGGS